MFLAAVFTIKIFQAKITNIWSFSRMFSNMSLEFMTIFRNVVTYIYIRTFKISVFRSFEFNFNFFFLNFAQFLNSQKTNSEILRSKVNAEVLRGFNLCSWRLSKQLLCQAGFIGCWKFYSQKFLLRQKIRRKISGRVFWTSFPHDSI